MPFSEGIHVLVVFYPCPESLKYDQFKCNELIYFIEEISSHGNTQVTDGRLLAAFSQLYTDNQGKKFYNTEMKVCSLEPDRAVWTYRKDTYANEIDTYAKEKLRTAQWEKDLEDESPVMEDPKMYNCKLI